MGNLVRAIGCIAVISCTYHVGKIVGKAECLKDMGEIIHKVCSSEDDDSVVITFGKNGVNFYKKRVSNDESN